MASLWDEKMSEERIEQWLYGVQSTTGLTRRWLLEQAANWKAGTTVLDVGCGGGVTAYQLNHEGLLSKLRYTGFDGSKNMLAVAKRKTPEVEWVHGDIAEMNLNRKFDKIVLRAVLAHVLEPAPILKAVFKHLEKDGELFIIFWNNPVNGKSIIATIEEGFYDNAHSIEQLKEIIATAGMKIKSQHVVEEKSARSNIRNIWVLEHCSQ
jgi:2-polyprenyl-3-methyl-5-hydroxy-6-metoxy-1,4-benzoquinol methylase